MLVILIAALMIVPSLMVSWDLRAPEVGPEAPVPATIETSYQARSGVILASHSVITINNNAQFAAKATAEGWSGSGTEMWPYVIQGYLIDGQRGGNCIFVGNTTVYFIVRDCELTNARPVASPYREGSGICLYNVTHATIQNNFLWNSDKGVMLDGKANNNTIEDNSAKYNYYGFYGVNCKDNLVLRNNFSHNDNYGIRLNMARRNNLTSNDCSYNSYGIYMGNNPIGNTATDNLCHRCGNYGIYIDSGEKNHLIGNECSWANTAGISLSSTRYCDLAFNSMWKSSIYIRGYGLSYYLTHTIDDSNSVNGKPVRFYKDENAANATVPSNTGQVILVKMSWIGVVGLDLSGTTYPLTIFYCQDVQVTDNNLSGASYGIRAFSTDRLVIQNNRMTSCGYGISTEACPGLRIQNNNASSSSTGISIYSSSGAKLIGNQLYQSSIGIDIQYSYDCELYSNVLTKGSIDLGWDEPTFSTQIIPANNTVNGKEILYLANANYGNATFAPVVGQLILGNVSWVTFSGLAMDNSTYGVLMGYCDNVTIKSSIFSLITNAIYIQCSATITVDDVSIYEGSNGVYLADSTNCLISNSYITRAYNCLYLEYSNSNTIFNVNATYSSGGWGYGVYLYESHGNLIKQSSLGQHYIGIYVYYSDYTTVDDCAFYGVYQYAVYWYYCSNLALNNNHLSGCPFFSEGSFDDFSTTSMAGNTVGGKPIYFLANADLGGLNIPVGDYGQIFLGNVSNARVTGQSISNIKVAMVLGYCNAIQVDANDIHDCYYGIFAKGTSNSQIHDNTFMHNSYSVYAYSSNSNTIQGNQFTGDYSDGIYLSYSQTNQVLGNTFTNCYQGVEISSCGGNVLSSNAFVKCSLMMKGTKDQMSSTSVEISNTVNGGSLLYVKNADLNNATISTAGIGQLILCNVRNARVTGLSLANATVAVLMVHSSRVTLDHSSFSNNKYSVYAYFSDHCTIANSRSSNSRSGFYLYESDYNLITGCNATSANDYGIWMQYSDGNVVTNCSTDTSYYSIGQQYSLGNAITNNMIAHGSYQLYAYNCRYGSIRDNTCERGYCAMYVYGTCYDLTVTGNRLFNSSWYGIYTSGCNGNFFFGNKLVGNRGAGQVYSSSHVQAYDSADGLNFWDNIAGVGNYWGDWTYPDANHDGIVDYPYVLTGNVKNKDRYPVSDTTPPELTITAPTEGQSVMTSDIDATWSGSDKQSGISRYEAQVDDGSWVNLSEQTHYALSLSGGQHTLGVRAYDRALNLRERYVTFVIVSVPDAPTNTIAVAGASQVMVSWHPGSDGGSAIIEYRILRSLVSGDYSAAVTAAVAPTATTYADSGVTAGTTYYYVVKARNAKGDSLASNEAMVVFGSGTLPPDSPTLSLFASSVGADYVCLAWIAPGNTGSSPITAYKVYRGTQPGGTSSLIATVTGAETTYYLDSGLAVGIYYYRVSAVNTIEGPRSNEVVATAGVVTGAPEKVTSISTSSHDNRIDLSWSAPSQGASAITQYRVYRSTVPGNLVLIGLPTGTSYTDGTVIKGQTYYYWIVAVNAQGQGPLSTQMKATATEPPASDMLLPIMLIIVVIAVVVFLLFLMKRRGKTTPIPSKQRGRVRATGRLSDGERGQELKGDRGFTQPASPPLPGTPPPPTPVPRPVPAATGLCPSCGKTYPFVQGMEFCPECGANLFK